MPVGQSRRGSKPTPGRPSAARAASSAWAETSGPCSGPAQLSHRPHGTASSSSSWRRRNSIRQPLPVAYSRIARCSASREAATLA